MLWKITEYIMNQICIHLPQLTWVLNDSVSFFILKFMYGMHKARPWSLEDRCQKIILKVNMAIHFEPLITTYPFYHVCNHYWLVSHIDVIVSTWNPKRCMSYSKTSICNYFQNIGHLSIFILISLPFNQTILPPRVHTIKASKYT